MGFNKTEEGIYYLHTYYPVRYVEHKGVSEEIIEFKNGSRPPIDRFAKELEVAILEQWGNNPKELEQMCIVVVPSHHKRQWGESLLAVASYLSQNLHIKNYSYLLKRIETRGTSKKGNRSIESLLSTMKLHSAYNIENKKIIILDDISTSGNTIISCKKLLKRAGVGQIEAVVIGKTCKNGQGTLRPEISGRHENDELCENW